MKKIYLIPTTKVVNIELTKMIAVSGGDPQGYNSTMGSTEVDGGDGLSRHSNSLWDDEEEE